MSAAIQQISDPQVRAFAEACYDTNTLAELRDATEPDAGDLETWTITEDQWREAVAAALAEIEGDREAAIAELRAADLHHAPGSETPLWEACRSELLSCETAERVQEALDWWRTAYDALDRAENEGIELDRIYAAILEEGVDPAGALGLVRRWAAVEALRSIRAELGLTLSELGDQLGVDRSTIHRWETEAALPQHPEMLRLALERLRAGR